MGMVVMLNLFQVDVSTPLSTSQSQLKVLPAVNSTTTIQTQKPVQVHVRPQPAPLQNNSVQVHSTPGQQQVQVTQVNSQQQQQQPQQIIIIQQVAAQPVATTKSTTVSRTATPISIAPVTTPSPVEKVSPACPATDGETKTETAAKPKRVRNRKPKSQDKANKIIAEAIAKAESEGREVPPVLNPEDVSECSTPQEKREKEKVVKEKEGT